MTNNSEATVIYLQSHPLWTAAQLRERQLQEAIHRHPAFKAKQRAAAMGGSVSSEQHDTGQYRRANGRG